MVISAALSKPDDKLTLALDVEPDRVFVGTKEGPVGAANPRLDAYVAFFYRGPEFQIIRAAVRGVNGRNEKPGLAIVGSTVQLSFYLSPVPRGCMDLVRHQMLTFASANLNPKRFGVASAGSFDPEDATYQTFERCVQQNNLIYLRIIGPGDSDSAYATYAIHEVKRRLETFLPERRA